MDATEKLVENLTAAAASSVVEMGEASRGRLVNACRQLLGALETPEQTLHGYINGVNNLIALRIAVDMGLFNAAQEISAQDGRITIDELASRTGADPILVGRVMRMLASMKIVTELGDDTFNGTPTSAKYVKDSLLNETVIFVASQVPRLYKMPEYLSINGYQNPKDAFNGPFQYIMDTSMHFFQWLETEPRIQKAFNTTMKEMTKASGDEWHQYFPVEQKLQVASPSDVLIVDVGGGAGHKLIDLKKKFPHLQGRFILQDLPQVIDGIQTSMPEGIEAMGYNIFSPQPIQGARAYYVSAVLHNWPEKQALAILENIRHAMGPDSLLLINDRQCPDTNAPPMLTQQDLIMMTNFAALERTKQQWQTLLAQAGFNVVRVWEAEETPQKVLIEAVCAS